MDLEDLKIEIDRRIDEYSDEHQELSKYADNEDYDETVERLTLSGRIDGLNEARNLIEEVIA